MTNNEQRPNIHDRFEDVLLYTTGYSRLAVDHKIMEDQDFRKVVKHMAKYFYHHNTGLCSRSGYYVEDIETILLMLGLVFMASEYPAADKHSRYTFLLHYLQQKQGRVVALLKRKYATSEIVFARGDFDDNTSSYTPSMEIPDPEPADPEPADPTKTELTARKSAASRRLEQLLEGSGERVKDSLAYYATIRVVGPDVRNKARSYCKKMQIDYIAWAKKYIAQHEFDKSEFIL